MIRFKTIRWKNLLSTGNVWTEIELDSSPTTLILGENGSGKSTILDAICFALFGKAFRPINKPGLINSVNEKGLVVELEFETNGKEYKIVRGLKPGIFEIYCNSTLINQDSTSRDYQEYLEKNVVRMSYKTFTQIVILGSSTYTPFMQLRPADRRSVIEDVLDIEIFTTMNTITKQKLILNREELEMNRLAASGKREKKVFIEKTIRSLQINQEEKSQSLNDQLSNYNTIIEELTLDIDVLESDRDALLAEAEGITRARLKHQELVAIEAKVENNLARKKKDIKFYSENDSCPTCKQTIDSAFKATIITDTEAKVTEYSKGLEDIAETITTCVHKISDMDKYIVRANALSMEITEKRSKIDHYEKLIISVEEDLEVIDKSDNLLKQNQKELQVTVAEILELEEEKEELLNTRQFLDIAVNLLKDGGIKTKIIKQYLPIINKQINKYLSIMGLYINFEINEQFEEIIKSRYRDMFSYHNFSEGEKMRINLAILLTWRDISRMRNQSHTNLLLMDEVLDSSMDTNGLDGFMKLIDGNKTNMIIISHRSEHMVDKFDRVVRFSKHKNFSHMEI